MLYEKKTFELIRTEVMSENIQIKLIEKIDALLPQTQCQKCGYPGCKPYAEALVKGEKINRCSPGGSLIINQLAKLLDCNRLPLAKDCVPDNVPHRVVVREADCIGCTKCIQACPVDAIIGAAKQMHTVIAADCTGCDLCITPCPTDCIDIVPLNEQDAGTLLSIERKQHNRTLYEQRLNRLEKQSRMKATSRQQRLHMTKTIKMSEKKDNHKDIVISAIKAQQRKIERQLVNVKEPYEKNQLIETIAKLDKKIYQLRKETNTVEPSSVNHLKCATTSKEVQLAIFRTKLKKLEKTLSLTPENSIKALKEEIQQLRHKINCIIK